MTEYREIPPFPVPDAGTESSGRSLAELAEQAAACNPGCCGATATVSTAAGTAGGPGGTGPAPGGGQPQTAVTHPDLTPLVTVQWESGEGPIPAALDSGRPAAAEDLLHDERWPRYRARALEAGVRSSTTLPFRRQGLTVAVTLYGFRPGPQADLRHGATVLLGDLATSALVRDLQHDRMRAELDQLDTALHARPVVDQACGIIMYVLGCDAEEAFALLRRMSQRTNRKLSELAVALVRTRGHGAESEIVRLGAQLAGQRPPDPGRPRAAPRGERADRRPVAARPRSGKVG